MKTAQLKIRLLNGAATSLTLIFFAAVGLASSDARAACAIDFENLPVGSTVTNQYAGVTFSIGNQSPEPTYMRIQNPEYGTTSSGTRCLKITPGAGSLSPEYLVMVFDLPQSHVSFTLGDFQTTYDVRYYTNPLGGTASGNQSVSTGYGVHTLVAVTGSGIRRIEVQSNPGGYFEAIDDLTLDSDPTPPIAEITYPAFGTCVCANEVIVLGRTCDDNYGADALEYMPVSGGAWTVVGSYTIPACTPNSFLYAWPTGLVPDGTYFLRLTLTNKCGLGTNAITVVTLDRSIDASAIRRPVSGTILGGAVCIDGFANDRCFNNYTVEYKPASGGSFAPVDLTNPSYTAQVAYDPLASWNTVNNATPDGSYLLRVTTFDTCGHSASNQISVVLDNTAPIGTISSPVQCSKRAGTIPIYGTAFDGNLAAWVLQYSDLNSHGWTDIASGSSAVFNGLLANWNTTGLPACAYALRLVVTDQSKVNMDCSGSSGANQTIYMLTLDLVSDQLAQDTDADGMPDAWEVAHGFNASDPSDAAQDADNDGKTNLEEYLAGTDPRDAGSVFRITSISRQGNDASVSWTAVGGHNYLLEAAPNLTSGLFSSISPLISMPTGAMTHFVHTNGGTAPERLYRLRLVR